MSRANQGIAPVPYNLISDLPQPPIPRMYVSQPHSQHQLSDVLCINCQEYINLDIIEEHSHLCTTVNDLVKRMDIAPSLEQVTFKIQKLNLRVEILKKDESYRPGDKNYISILLRLSQQLLNAANKQIQEDVSDVQKSLSSLLVIFEGSLNIRVYAERIQALAYELSSNLTELIENRRRQEVDNIRDKIDSYKNRVHTLENSLQKMGIVSPRVKEHLETITSDVGSLAQTIPHSGNSSSLDYQSEYTNDIDDISTTIIRDYEQGEELKKYFFTKCLTIKMSFPPKSLAQKVPITALYERAINDRVKPEDWEFYIRKLLSDPVGMRLSLSKAGTRKNKAVPKFDVIQEEDFSDLN